MLAVGTYDLSWPSEHVSQLNNCYYVLVVCISIISVSCLDLDGFHFIIKNNIYSTIMETFDMLFAMRKLRKYAGHINNNSVPLRAMLSIPRGLMLPILIVLLLFSQLIERV